MANIGIIGYGFVGKALEYGFKGGDHKIEYYSRRVSTASFDEVIKKSEFIFMCLPTPFKGDKIDLSTMDELVGKVAALTKGTDKIIVIKSTVVPGTTKRYSETYSDCKFCANPEFLTEANYLHDFVNADRTVIGSTNKETRSKLAALYKEQFPNVQIFETDPTSAEMCKYMSNCLLATKVSFANEMYDLCDKLGINYNKVKEMVIADKRIGKTHLDVTPERGFGGKCFPKDMVALIGRFKELELDVSVLEAVWAKNLKIRTVRDWENIPGAMTKD